MTVESIVPLLPSNTIKVAKMVNSDKQISLENHTEYNKRFVQLLKQILEPKPRLIRIISA